MLDADEGYDSAATARARCDRTTSSGKGYSSQPKGKVHTSCVKQTKANCWTQHTQPFYQPFSSSPRIARWQFQHAELFFSGHTWHALPASQPPVSMH